MKNLMDNQTDSAETPFFGKPIIHWQVPEYEEYERGQQWYVYASAVGLFLVVYSFFTLNFLFAVIVIIAALVIVLNDGRKPALVDVILATEGIVVGRKFYDYDELKNFSIIYKPTLGIKNLYIEMKNPVKPRLSIPLENINPLPIRENLLKYLTEDLERIEQPFSESIAKLFKL